MLDFKTNMQFFEFFGLLGLTTAIVAIIYNRIMFWYWKKRLMEQSKKGFYKHL